jgi:chromosome segregation ATPase
MKDLAREKYVKLMDEIEKIEDVITQLEDESPVDQKQLDNARAELSTKKNELARISDGCGKPHPN